MRAWAHALPLWLEVLPVAPDDDNPLLALLDKGEKAAISLGHSLHADVILIDDRKGVAVAVKMGLQASGTLGLLKRAAQRNLLDLAEAFTLLKKTNFRYRPELMEALLGQSRKI